jgi:FKBP-type peptidyl-prolyl cis-trans isomerase FkpA
MVVGLFSCKTYSDDDKNKFDTTIQKYIRQKKIEGYTKSPSGLYYVIKASGQGRFIRYTDSVTFRYRGSLLNGKVFDDVKKPVSFPVRELIGAWKEVMLELKAGSKVWMITPPQLAYGEYKLIDIPQHSILVFEMEIIEAK